MRYEERDAICKDSPQVLIDAPGRFVNVCFYAPMKQKGHKEACDALAKALKPFGIHTQRILQHQGACVHFMAYAQIEKP